MKPALAVGLALVLALVLFLVERGTRPKEGPARADGPRPPPPEAPLVAAPDYLLLEAEGAVSVVPPFSVVLDREASGGKAIEIPEGTPENEHAERPESRKAEGTVVFRVRSEGDYRLWFRAWWDCSCGDSVNFQVDGAPPSYVTSSTTRSWQWVPWRSQDPESGSRQRTVHLAAGEHRLRLFNREDGIRLDQVLLTTDPEELFYPAGIMEKPAPAPAPPAP